MTERVPDLYGEGYSDLYLQDGSEDYSEEQTVHVPLEVAG